MNLSPLPKLAFLDNNGRPLVGGQLFTYEAGTSDKVATYQDQGGLSQNTNPIVLDYRGECNCWLDPDLTYKFVLAPRGDTDPPTNPIWSVDNIAAPFTLFDLTRQRLGMILYPLSPEEIAAGITSADIVLWYEPPQNVLRYGADNTGVDDSFDAFTLAALLPSPVVPCGTYLVNDQINIIDDQTWTFDGPLIYHTDDQVNIFSAVEASNWNILGSVVLEGTLTVADTNPEIGLYIEKCRRYRVENVESRLFTGCGIKLTGDTSIPGNFRGERGQFVACSVYENTVGLQIDVGAASEYNTWEGLMASGNVRALDVAAGNNTFIGGSIVDNTEGVYVRNGSNHAHGIFSGVNINHNLSYNIKCEGVTNGQDFVGCHIYGDSTSTGFIWFVNSKGCHVKGGTIDAPIQNDGSTGLNYITDNQIAGSNAVLSGTGTAYLVKRLNFTGTAPWDLDDPSDVYVQATRATSTQSLSGVTTVIFNNEEADNRAAYDPTTGVFTAPYAGRYRFTCNMHVTGTSLTDTYMQWLKNAGTVAFAPLVAFSTSNQVGYGEVVINMNAADTMALQIDPTGSSPVVVSSGKARLTVELLH